MTLNSVGSLPPSEFIAYIEQGKRLAISRKLNWKMDLDSAGYASPTTAWDLRILINDGNPIQAKLRNFSTVSKVYTSGAFQSDEEPTPSASPLVVSSSWQDLIKSYVLNHVLVQGLSMSYLAGVCNAIRLIATVTHQKPLWLLNAVDLQQCVRVARDIQASGQTAIIIVAFVKTVIDAYHLANACPLFPSIQSERPNSPSNRRAAKFKAANSKIRNNLSDRKDAQKLPEQEAFWELTRIAFTEKPRTFTDAIRFAQCKLLILTGLRLGEVALIPFDWKRLIEYRAADGKSADTYGGFANALLLRHFAEKQGSRTREIGALWENTQFVPSIFQDLVCDVLSEIAKLTAPLRQTLKSQVDSGRILYMYPADSVQPISALYPKLTGNALYKDLPRDVTSTYLSSYRESFDVTILDELMRLQAGSSEKVTAAFYNFANRLRDEGVTFRNADGSLWFGRGVTNQYLRVDEVENYIRERLPTKVSDVGPFKLAGGEFLQSYEMMFLIPKRAVAEGRGGPPVHVGITTSVGIATPEILGNSLTSNGPNGPSLFHTYSSTPEEKSLLLLPHSLRHLQNTELFRLGVADTVITKRFNRRSTAQSYEYDHRSLQEELDQISLPDEWEEFLGPRASSVAKLVKIGRANGPIVSEFKRLEKAYGDEAAYSYLKGEADGFHATPYGHCLNSFTVAPCPTHLECFNGCSQLSATNLPENRRNLIALRGKLKAAVDLARSQLPGTVGRENQIIHAETRLNNLENLLAAEPGTQVFPEGRNLSIGHLKKDLFNGT